MHTYTITEKEIDEDGLIYEIELANIAFLFSHIERDTSGVKVIFTQMLGGTELTAWNALVENHNASTYATKKYVLALVQDAMAFGTGLIAEFGTENTLMGIEQYGMTRTVRLKTADVMSALSAGALLDGIQAMRDIDPSDYDAVFITEPRLLEYINKCELYMGLPKSTEV